MELPRQNPNQLLRTVRDDAQDAAKGKLKIFFGYAAGVGKTYAMIQAAHQARERGTDVVAGYIEPHARPQTAALAEGLEQIPAKQVIHGGITLREFDLDAALRRKPQLILVDEFAHTNAEGSRHAKRYQDVEELLAAGIDVYTTVNVQHIESLNDTVASITGVLVRERIPDSVFDQADQVELVDIEPEELLERMAGGDIYGEDQARRAASHFFTVENLTALREIALRRCADRVNLLTESTRIQNRGDYHTEEHILVCLSSSPSNGKIIRTAARMAQAFRGSFTALFVETPGAAAMGEEDRKRLRENMRLAEQLGAAIETVYGEDVSYQIAEFARLSGVSKIVIGRSTAARRGIFGKLTLTDKLIAAAPNLDIHVIPEAASWNYSPAGRRGSGAMAVRDVGRSVLVLLAATLIGYGFYDLGFTEANIVAVYIFGVLVTSIITTSRLCGFLASVVSVLVFNFFFTVPRFTFQFNDPDYPVTFFIMFMVAFLTGSLAGRLKENARQSARAAFRTKILLETNQLLQKETDEAAILRVTARQLTKLLKKDLVIYPSDGRSLGEPEICRAAEGGQADLTAAERQDGPTIENRQADRAVVRRQDDLTAEDRRADLTVENRPADSTAENREANPTAADRQADLTAENERRVAEWVLQNNKRAGATTDTLGSARCLYLAIRQNSRVYGVVGICMEEIPLDSFENSVVLSILGECALALENRRNASEKEEAAVMAKNEQLRANLLRAISHDLRTPLTSICGSAENLMANYRKMDDATRGQTFTDIYDDSMWLINLVENLLAVTRIDGGQVSLSRSVELMDEVVAEALRHISRKSGEHTIRVCPGQELLLADIDAKLIVQVLINLVDNAVKYTPAGSVIEIAMKKEGDQIAVSVSDNGPGIPDEQKPHIFEMFYSGANRVADSRRSLGLGLALCKSIIAAHGGQIGVSDNHPAGTVFTFTLPAGEVELHE